MELKLITKMLYKKALKGKEKIIAYNWYFPNELNTETILAILLILVGILSVYALENFAIDKK